MMLKSVSLSFLSIDQSYTFLQKLEQKMVDKN